MVCGTPDCGWLGTSWDVINEAIVCPKCHTDESGIAGMIDPCSLIGTFAEWRGQVVRILEYYGGNSFRILDRGDITYTASILSFTKVDLPPLQAA